MVQVKKDAVRQKIVETADGLFEERGYVATTMSQIAKAAGVASSTIYVYFPSKLDVAVAVFEPWLFDRLRETADRAARIEPGRERLEYVLSRLWHDIPLERNNYINSLMQALAVSTRENDYERKFLEQLRTQVRSLIEACLSEEAKVGFDAESFAHIAVMAFDGFVINGHLAPSTVRDGMIIGAACDMILGSRGR